MRFRWITALGCCFLPSLFAQAPPNPTVGAAKTVPSKVWQARGGCKADYNKNLSIFGQTQCRGQVGIHAPDGFVLCDAKVEDVDTKESTEYTVTPIWGPSGVHQDWPMYYALDWWARTGGPIGQEDGHIFLTITLFAVPKAYADFKAKTQETGLQTRIACPASRFGQDQGPSYLGNPNVDAPSHWRDGSPYLIYAPEVAAQGNCVNLKNRILAAKAPIRVCDTAHDPSHCNTNVLPAMQKTRNESLQQALAEAKSMSNCPGLAEVVACSADCESISNTLPLPTR